MVRVTFRTTTSTVFSFYLMFSSLGLTYGQTTTATLQGSVRDRTDAVIPGVTITVINPATGLRRTALTGDTGSYQVSLLPPGNYDVRAELSGFQTAIHSSFKLEVGQIAKLDLTLEVGSPTTEVRVSAEDVPLVETANSTVSNVVEQRRVVELPLNGRDFLQLATLQPGIVSTPNSPTTSAGGTTGRLTKLGTRPSQNSFFLDGTDINDFVFGTLPLSAAGGLLGVDLLGEFRVQSNSYTAEFGRSGGMAVNAITRSGTNRLHGSVFEFLRNDELDARNFFDGEDVPEFKQNDFGFSLGGPIIRDRLFFFGGYEGFRQRRARSAVSIVPDANARMGLLPDPTTGGMKRVEIAPRVRPFLDALPLPNAGLLGNGAGLHRAEAGREVEDDFFSVRVDANVTDRDTFFARYTFSDASDFDPFALTPVPGFPEGKDSRLQFSTVEWSRVFSPKIANVARFAYNRTNKSNIPLLNNPDLVTSLAGATFPGQVNVAGLSTFGTRRTLPLGGPLNVFQWSDVFTWNSGSHSFKFGTDIKRIQVNDTLARFLGGFSRIDSLEDFLTGRQGQFQGVLPGGNFDRALRSTSFAFYGQDSFKILPNLTLDFGLRWEPYKPVLSEDRAKISVLRFRTMEEFDQRTPADLRSADSFFWESNPSKTNFAPRAGFAWDPFNDGKTSVRGGFGIFYDVVYSNAVMIEQRSNPPFAQTVVVNDAPFPLTPDALARGTLPAPAIGQVAPGFDFPYVMNYNLSIEKEILPSIAVTVGYTGSAGRHLLNVESDVNVPIPQVLPDGSPFFPANAARRNPNFSSVRLIRSDLTSNFNSLVLQLQRRSNRGLILQGSYTYSRSIDDLSAAVFEETGASSAFTNIFDRRRDRGRSTFDVQHRFTVNYLYPLPLGPGRRFGATATGLAARLLEGWQFGGITTIQSGTPFSPKVAFNRSRSMATDASGPVDRPDLKPGVRIQDIILGGPDRYFDINAFALPAAGHLGNAGRNILEGPGLVNFDVSLNKDIKASEAVTVQFRTEVFNLFNRANFANPDDIGSNTSKGARIFTNATGVPNPGAARILRTVTDARTIQFGLKVIF